MKGLQEIVSGNKIYAMKEAFKNRTPLILEEGDVKMLRQTKQVQIFPQWSATDPEGWRLESSYEVEPDPKSVDGYLLWLRPGMGYMQIGHFGEKGFSLVMYDKD